MKFEEYNKAITSHQELEDNLSSSVSISWREVLRLTTEDIIRKRKSCKDEELIKCLDKVLKSYYLTEEEFDFHIGEKDE